MLENKGHRSCENCGNAKCANSPVAYLWDYCVADGFTKYWRPKLKPGPYIRVEPFKPEHSTGTIIAMMPLRKNVPEGRPDWELRTCPVCGRECWYQTDNMKQLEIMATGSDLRLRCTECALKEGTVTE